MSDYDVARAIRVLGDLGWLVVSPESKEQARAAIAGIDVDRLHAALARALPASFGTGHVADERREVEAIAREYAKDKA